MLDGRYCNCPLSACMTGRCSLNLPLRMSLCVYIYIYIYIYLYLYNCVCVCVSKYICTCACIDISALKYFAYEIKYLSQTEIYLCTLGFRYKQVFCLLVTLTSVL